MNKKAQGLSMNTIIIAAIALIVLVVIVAIFTGRLGLFSKGVNEMTTCQQICDARGYEGRSISVGPDDSNPDENSFVKILGGRDAEGNQCWCPKPIN